MEWIYGYHAVYARLHYSTENVRTLYLRFNRQDQRVQSLLELAEKANVPVIRLTKKKFDTLLGKGPVHQGIALECEILKSFDESALKILLSKKAFASNIPVLLLVLDGVQDPHNLGACIRSANAMGAHAVIAPEGRSVSITATVKKVACGAVDVTPFIQVKNLARTLRFLQKKGIWIVGASEKAEIPLKELDLSGDTAIVVGGEHQGMRRLTVRHCDFLAHVPMLGSVSSLNISAVTSVFLYEAQRQR